MAHATASGLLQRFNAKVLNKDDTHTRGFSFSEASRAAVVGKEPDDTSPDADAGEIRRCLTLGFMFDVEGNLYKVEVCADDDLDLVKWAEERVRFVDTPAATEAKILASLRNTASASAPMFPSSARLGRRGTLAAMRCDGGENAWMFCKSVKIVANKGEDHNAAMTQYLAARQSA